jgi:hypothetical protein
MFTREEKKATGSHAQTMLRVIEEISKMLGSLIDKLR